MKFLFLSSGTTPTNTSKDTQIPMRRSNQLTTLLSESNPVDPTSPQNNSQNALFLKHQSGVNVPKKATAASHSKATTAAQIKVSNNPDRSLTVKRQSSVANRRTSKRLPTKSTEDKISLTGNNVARARSTSKMAIKSRRGRMSSRNVKSPVKPVTATQKTRITGKSLTNSTRKPQEKSQTKSLTMVRKMSPFKSVKKTLEKNLEIYPVKRSTIKRKNIAEKTRLTLRSAKKQKAVTTPTKVVTTMVLRERKRQSPMNNSQTKKQNNVATLNTAATIKVPNNLGLSLTVPRQSSVTKRRTSKRLLAKSTEGKFSSPGNVARARSTIKEALRSRRGRMANQNSKPPTKLVTD